MPYGLFPKLVKIHDRLYVEPDTKNENEDLTKATRWPRGYEYLSLTLENLCCVSNFVLNNQHTFDVETIRVLNGDVETTRVINSNDSSEMHEAKPYVFAKGRTEHRTINIINSDVNDRPISWNMVDVYLRRAKLNEGQTYSAYARTFFETTDRQKKSSYDPAFDKPVFGEPLRPVPSHAGGILYHIADDHSEPGDEPFAPCIGLNLFIPPWVFDEAWKQLQAGFVKKAVLEIFVDVFQSSLERALAEPYHRQDFAIERNTGNTYAQFVNLSLTSPTFMLHVDEGDESEAAIAEDREETPLAPLPATAQDIAATRVVFDLRAKQILTLLRIIVATLIVLCGIALF